jgi:hypothetical protein
MACHTQHGRQICSKSTEENIVQNNDSGRVLVGQGDPTIIMVLNVKISSVDIIENYLRNWQPCCVWQMTVAQNSL